MIDCRVSRKLLTWTRGSLTNARTCAILGISKKLFDRTPAAASIRPLRRSSPARSYTNLVTSHTRHWIRLAVAVIRVAYRRSISRFPVHPGLPLGFVPHHAALSPTGSRLTPGIGFPASPPVATWPSTMKPHRAHTGKRYSFRGGL